MSEENFEMVAVKRKWVPEWLFAICAWPIDLVIHQPFRWALTTPVKKPQVAIPTGIELMVCQDIAERQQMGIKKYGQTVIENNADLKTKLTHAYQECLDQAIYLKWAITDLEEREGKVSDH